MPTDAEPTELRGPDPEGLAADWAEARADVEPTFADGRYQLEEALGRGGMGVVYRAYDQELCRPVALKVTRREVDHDRFLEEARVTAQLEHPGVIPVYDMGQTSNGQRYYTMRLVQGRTLAELILDEDAAFWGEEPVSAAAWSFRRLASVLIMACQAVEYAHQRGVLHRDVKPANVMVGALGSVYVVDWGLAKVLDPEQVELGQERDATQVGAVVGTPIFMAPEQAAGDPAHVGTPADVYALGGILYLLLTGVAPREGRASEIWQQIARRDVPQAPSELQPTVPRGLDQVCRAALSATPSERPSAGQLADAIAAYLEGRAG